MNTFLQGCFGLTGRRAVVTGGSRGIGRAIAVALAGAGAQVLVHCRSNRQAADDVVRSITESGGEAWSIAADLCEPAQVSALVDAVASRWGALDILVNCTGALVKRASLKDSDDQHIRDVLDVNLVSNLRMTRAALGLLERGNEPVVINVSSVSAHSGGYGGVSVYVASKGAILSLTRSLAKELAPRIRVNGIAPGVIMTDLHREHSTPDALESIRRSTPLARLGRPEDCAGAVVFLASPAGAFVTGETIEVNGGLWMA